MEKTKDSTSFLRPVSQRVSFLPQLASFWESLPTHPGVYFFEDKNKEPLYIGKSINLKSRLRQHYEGFLTNSSKAVHFVPQTKTLFLKILQNDIQAVITESNYIKSHQPKYNSITKDGKTNTYLVFTNQPDTKLLISHGSDLSTFNLDNYEKQVFGPYTSGATALHLQKICRRTFGACLRPFNSAQKSCFNYHLHRCPGACNGQITHSEYQKHLGKIKKFLSGQFNLLLKQLNKDIKKEIKLQNFETASRLKFQIESLDKVLSARHTADFLKLSDANSTVQNKIVTTLNHPLLKETPRRIECYDLAHLQTKNYMGAMSVFLNGEKSPENYRHFIVNTPDFSDPHAMKQILIRRLGHPEWGTPDLIVLDGGLPQLSTVSPIIPEKIPVIALAKKLETIYFYDKNHKAVSLSLPLEDPVLNLFRSLRDEAHRLANSFHKKRRSKLE